MSAILGKMLQIVANCCTINFACVSHTGIVEEFRKEIAKLHANKNVKLFMTIRDIPTIRLTKAQMHQQTRIN
jgi:hypothetical protein